MYAGLIKPAIDFIFSLILLMVLSPLFLLVVITLAITGRGIWFNQLRSGRHGHPFLMYKFRTMTDAKDNEGKLLPEAERLTKVGKWLRGLSLDELPQLLNVLIGEMSLIGPRPLLPEYSLLYNEFQRTRLNVRPGITGWAQVNGRNSISWEQKFALDKFYVDNLSFSLDFRILIKTFVLLLSVRKDTSIEEKPFKGN